MTDRTALLSGWGRTAPTGALLDRPASAEEVAAIVGAPARGRLARGLGRCYGDAAQSAGGRVISMLDLADIDLDEQAGTAVVGAGCSIDELLRVVVPRGWFVPVTPGTRFVTIGGAIAADVHGKNHHVDGAFGRHVRWLELVDATGAVRRLSPSDDPDAFWATVGGLGLTGVITRAEITLRRIGSSWMRVTTARAGNLEQLMQGLRDHDRQHRYTVAWIDVISRGRALGRGVITSGDHAAAADVGPAVAARPCAYGPRAGLTMPPLPMSAVNPASVRAFNEVWFRKAPVHEDGALQRLQAFFHPLDGVRAWNRAYGPHGFVQYQFVVPDGREDVVESAVTSLQRAGAPSFLAVLKRFGEAGPAPLSFPRPGWTLAMDLPVRDDDRLAAVLDELDEQVVDAGGAVYLVKDSRCRPELVARMYPRLDAWREVRERLDPQRRFASDLSRRLGL
jgi:decaprenylphospho-beta-D-ribofuranose 2-oxidase